MAGHCGRPIRFGIDERMQRIPPTMENSAQMTKGASFAIAVATLILSGIAGALQSPAPRTPMSVKHAAIIGPDHPITRAVSTTKLVPAPVIGPAEALFLGTGDGSNGGWVDP